MPRGESVAFAFHKQAAFEVARMIISDLPNALARLSRREILPPPAFSRKALMKEPQHFVLKLPALLRIHFEDALLLGVQPGRDEKPERTRRELLDTRDRRMQFRSVKLFRNFR